MRPSGRKPGELRPVPAHDPQARDLPIAAIAAAVEHFTNGAARAPAAEYSGGGDGRRNGWREQARRDALRAGTWNW